MVDLDGYVEVVRSSVSKDEDKRSELELGGWLCEPNCTPSFVGAVYLERGLDLGPGDHTVAGILATADTV